jgi:two-component system chemotaxis response regulator CheB
MSLRVLVVDDSALIRNVLTDIINGAPDMRVVGSASDALQAREQVRALNPDVLTLDVEMPGMDGLEFLGRLMRGHPMPVVMVSASTERGSETTLRALELGAVDFITKPRGDPRGLRDYAELLREKLRTAAQARITPRPSASASAVGRAATPPKKPLLAVSELTTSCRVIVVGASTGGTEAIREFLSRMPANAPPILVTQHMPEAFTKAFAARLNAASALTVTEAVHGEPALPGHAYVAPGHSHLPLRRRSGRGARHRCHPHRHGQGWRRRHAGHASGRRIQPGARRSQLRRLRHAARGHRLRRHA